jgi:FAD synthetase
MEQEPWRIAVLSIINPMATILPLQKLDSFPPCRENGRTVLVGGCFDILHIGHVRFLSQARKLGDYLVVLLESDTKVRQLKGKGRPAFIQEERAETLAALESVDLVVLLPAIEDDDGYSDLIMKIKPDVIAITANDPLIETKMRQAEKIGGELKVIPHVNTASSSTLAKILESDKL